MAIESFAPGTLIIPMDVTYQDEGMFKAYGLVYNLLSNGIPVKWAIQPGKAYDGTDFTTSAQDIVTLAPITTRLPDIRRMLIAASRLAFLKPPISRTGYQYCFRLFTSPGLIQL